MDKTRAFEWVVSGDVGVSSRTIWAVMMGCGPALRDSGIPLDGDDFGRCYRLLARIPEWRARMPEVSDAFPEWRPLTEHWDELTRLYEADPSECRKKLRQLWPDCMRAAGLIESPSGSFWMRRP